MAKIKVEETFEVFAVVDQFGGFVTDEFTGQLCVFYSEEEALNECDVEGLEQVVKVKGNFRYKAKQL